MKPLRFALTECFGLAVDLAITSLMFRYTTIDPWMARLPGAIAGIILSCILNSRVSNPPAHLSGFLKNTITLLSRIVGFGIFALLQSRNPLLQPLVPLIFSVVAALAFALIGYVRIQKRNASRL